MVVLPMEAQVGIRRLTVRDGRDLVEAVVTEHPASALVIPAEEFEWAAQLCGYEPPRAGDCWRLTGRLHLMIGAPSEPHRGWYVMVERAEVVTRGMGVV